MGIASNKLGLGLHSFGGQEHGEAQNIGGQLPPSPETFQWQLPAFDSVPSWIPGIAWLISRENCNLLSDFEPLRQTPTKHNKTQPSNESYLNLNIIYIYLPLSKQNLPTESYPLLPTLPTCDSALRWELAIAHAKFVYSTTT